VKRRKRTEEAKKDAGGPLGKKGHPDTLNKGDRLQRGGPSSKQKASVSNEEEEGSPERKKRATEGNENREGRMFHA